MLVAILQYIPAEDDPYGIVSRLMGATAPGSQLVVSHPASDIAAEQVAESMRRYNEGAAEQATPRDHAGVSRFFDGLELIDPGVVPIPQWRPSAASDTAEGTASIAMWGGVARKARPS
jgi:hypothetical protein